MAMASRWIRRFRPDSNGTAQLVCFPHAGGSAAFWYPLASRLAPDVDVLAVQYPGRQERYREEPIEDLHRLADLIADVLADPETTEDRRARIFLGHSMGASLAYEVAVRLADAPAGVGPMAVVVSGRRAPSRPRSARESLRDDRALIARLRALGGTEEGWLDDPDLLQLILPAVRADYRAIGAYRGTQGTALSVPVAALAGAADGEASVDDVAAWREHTSGPFALRVLPGGHFFVREQFPVVADVVAELVTGLAAESVSGLLPAGRGGGAG
jgi:surfactin synthase thioesterase subunit